MASNGSTHALADLDRKELLARYEILEKDFGTLQNKLDRSERENAVLRTQLRAKLRRMFGPRSERAEVLQGELFAQATRELKREAAERLRELTEAEPTCRSKQRRGGRRPLPADLVRERKVYELPSRMRQCPGCKTTMQRFGCEVTEELEYVPASLRIIEHVREK